MFVICKPCVGLTVYGSPSDESGGHIRGYRLHHDQHQQHQSGGGLQTGKQGKVFGGGGGGGGGSARLAEKCIIGFLKLE